MKAGRHTRRAMARFLRYVNKEERRARDKRDAEVTSEYGERAHRMCGRKRSYATMRHAEEMAAKYTVMYNVAHRAYRCPICGAWHLTTRDERQDTHASE